MAGFEAVWTIGLMSGTSCDGIDAALLKTDGETVSDFGPTLGVAYDADFRARLKSCLGGQGPIADVEHELTERHAAAVMQLLSEAGMTAGDVAYLGFHGQTVLHAPRERRTWQIGEGALLARLTGIPVVNDFRKADVAAGGQGAPFVPAFHRALAIGLEKPLAVLNIGGVANVTWIGHPGIDGGDQILAFDTGPGNAMIDDWMLKHVGKPVDLHGALAQAGLVDEAAVARFLAHRFFALPAPKSLDRDDFRQFVLQSVLGGLNAADGAATLTAITAAAVAAARAHFPKPAVRWLVTGGGRLNPTLMDELRRRLQAPVDPVEAVGWNGDALEAQAFAYLAVRSVRGLPLSFPTTTGVPQPMTGGKLHRPAA
jgi:anhydro-N-acetylmuramic acid kinase